MANTFAETCFSIPRSLTGLARLTHSHSYDRPAREYGRLEQAVLNTFVAKVDTLNSYRRRGLQQIDHLSHRPDPFSQFTFLLL